MQLGIRLHDVNTSAPEAERTLEARAEKARAEGFRCVHLALSKCISGVSFDGTGYRSAGLLSESGSPGPPKGQ